MTPTALPTIALPPTAPPRRGGARAREAGGGRRARRAVLLLLLSAAAGAGAQTPDSTAQITLPPPAPGGLDARVERAINGIEARPFAAVMRGVNGAAYPAFIGAAPVAAGVGLLQGDSVRPAARIAAAEAGALGVTFVLKRVFHRPRPYRGMPDIVARDPHHQSEEVADPNSFPSGHAAAAFAIATSISLSDGRLAAPALLWATAVSVSRVWHGVHYPSDILAGAVLGVGSATVVHVVAPVILGDHDGGGPRPTVPFHIVVAF